MQTVSAKTIVTRMKNSYWFGADYNMNIYRGCSHGCIYCDSRSDCYRVDDFDVVKGKENAIEIISRELKSKRKKGVVATGAMSDPYNPQEKTYKLTRQALGLIRDNRFGIAVATKSNLVARDADILCEIAGRMPVIVKMTVTACDDGLSRKVEPYAPASSRRFEAVRQLNREGVFAGILMMPVLPFIEDSMENILGIVRCAADCGARFVYPAMGMTLRDGQREFYYDALDGRFPGLRQKYVKLYGANYQCNAIGVRELYKAFSNECERRGVLYKMRDIIEAYQKGYGEEKQLSFL